MVVIFDILIFPCFCAYSYNFNNLRTPELSGLQVDPNIPFVIVTLKKRFLSP